MVARITLRLDEDDTFLKENVTPFRDINKARDCFRAGELEIRKCTGPPTAFEIRAAEYSRSKKLEEDLNKALTDMENRVDICHIKTIDTSNNITKNLTLVDEGVRIGLLHSVDKNKIDSIKNRFELLKTRFIDNCECKIK